MLRSGENLAAILNLTGVRPPSDTWPEQRLLGRRHLPASCLLSEVGHGYRGGTSSLGRCSRGRGSGVIVHVSRQHGMDGFVIVPAEYFGTVGSYGKRDRS